MKTTATTTTAAAATSKMTTTTTKASGHMSGCQNYMPMIKLCPAGSMGSGIFVEWICCSWRNYGTT
jgi:hypothetical protein